jgi:integrase
MSGHIRKRGERSWELKFDLGTDPLTGKRLTRYHSFKGTKREAQDELDRLRTGAKQGDYVDPSTVTFNEFLDRWDADWASSNVSPKTLERYRELAKCHIRPHLGAAKVQKLKPVNFAALYAKLLREGRRPATVPDRESNDAANWQLVDASAQQKASHGLSPRTVGHVHRLLHRALGHAVQWGLIATNPVEHVDPPKVEPTEIEILTEDQARGVLQKVRGHALYPLVLLGLATGMRRGELLALRWKDVDLDGAKLRVEQSLEQTKAGGLRFKSPKTKHGRRAIALPASVVAELRSHWKAQQETRLRAGLGKAPDDALVFGNWNGSPRSPNATTKDWTRLVSTLGLPHVTLHALRHTHASQLIASGMDVLTISRRLGHGSPTITLSVYGHLFANSDDRAAAVVEAAFGRLGE